MLKHGAERVSDLGDFLDLGLGSIILLGIFLERGHLVVVL